MNLISDITLQLWNNNQWHHWIISDINLSKFHHDHSYFATSLRRNLVEHNCIAFHFYLRGSREGIRLAWLMQKDSSIEKLEKCLWKPLSFGPTATSCADTTNHNDRRGTRGEATSKPWMPRLLIRYDCDSHTERPSIQQCKGKQQ